MKDISLMVWLTQLGLSVAVPLAGFVYLAAWLRKTYELGIWVLILGLGLGLYCAIHGFIQNLKMLNRVNRKKKKEEPPVAFNDHN